MKQQVEERGQLVRSSHFILPSTSSFSSGSSVLSSVCSVLASELWVSVLVVVSVSSVVLSVVRAGVFCSIGVVPELLEQVREAVSQV